MWQIATLSLLCISQVFAQNIDEPCAGYSNLGDCVSNLCSEGPNNGDCIDTFCNDCPSTTTTSSTETPETTSSTTETSETTSSTEPETTSSTEPETTSSTAGTPETTSSTADVTTSTGQPQTSSTAQSTEPETSTAASTSTTTESATTTESSESSDESSTTSKPTSSPTLPSAMKWEMIHPAYQGGDGELLWQVYYGDFSGDERFDDFRQKEMWDAHELRMVLSSDSKFGALPSNINALTDGSSSSYAIWIVSGVVLFLALLSCYFKLSSGDRAEYKPLPTYAAGQQQQTSYSTLRTYT